MKLKKSVCGLMAFSMAACTLLSACGSSTASSAGSSTGEAAATGDKIQIEFLNGLTGGDGDYMRKITAGFNASQEK